MSENISQIYIANPSTTLGNNDLIYSGKSPYGPTNDSAIKFSNLLSQIQSSPTSFPQNSVIFAGASGVLSSSANFTWDTANNNFMASNASVITGGAAACAILAGNNNTITTSSGSTTSSSVLAGLDNTVVDGQNSAVVAGISNSAQQNQSVVINGQNNTITADNGCAIGRHVTISHANTCIISDGAHSLSSTNSFQMMIGAANGFGFYSGVMNLTTSPNNFMNFYMDTGTNHPKLQYKDNSGNIATYDFLAPVIWTTVSGTSQAMTPFNGYIPNNAALVTFTLPITSNVGDMLYIQGKGTGGWKVDYTTNQQIIVGNQSSTVTTGSIGSTNQYDSITLVCITANDVWASLGGPEGNINIV